MAEDAEIRTALMNYLRSAREANPSAWTDKRFEEYAEFVLSGKGTAEMFRCFDGRSLSNFPRAASAST